MFEDNVKADYGWDAPIRTKRKCANPDFYDHHKHRVAIMKDEHWGSKGDRDEGGVPGWTIKLKCNGCGREFKKDGFFLDSKVPKHV